MKKHKVHYDILKRILLPETIKIIFSSETHYNGKI